jgi:hypothetical protein
LEDHAWKRDIVGFTSLGRPVDRKLRVHLPAGVVLVCESGQFEGARGSPCLPEDYEANEALLLPKRDRTASKYGRLWFVLLESEIGTSFDRA